MVASIPQIALPEAYPDLPFKQIRIKHVPETSRDVTPVLVLELHRPEKYNAFTDDVMMPEMEQAFQLFDVDDRVKAIVVTGAGKMFCAGADLDTGFQAGYVDTRDHRDGGGRVVIAIQNCRKPTIAAIQGSAVGIGITMTLPMTIRVAYEKAKIGFVFARRGIIMEACSSFYLPRLIGTSKALHLVSTGAVYEARHPLLNTLFSETLPEPAQVLPRALELADEIAKNCSTVSLYLMRELMYRDAGSPEAQHLLDSRVIFDLYSKRDMKEGVEAFMQKRPVHFVGTMQDDAPAAYPWWDQVNTKNRPRPEVKGLKPKL